MDSLDRTVHDPEILLEKPTIKGTRISVEMLRAWLAAGWSIDDLLRNYPQLTQEDVAGLAPLPPGGGGAGGEGEAPRPRHSPLSPTPLPQG